MILTVVVVFSAVMISPSVVAQADVVPSPTPVPLAAAVAVAQPLADYETELAAREAVLQEQLASRQEALSALDEQYKAQFTAFEGDLEQMTEQLDSAGARMATLTTEAEGLGSEVSAADLAFQEEMTGLQNSLVYEDGQLRGQIEAVYAQLEGAYAQIAAQEAQAASGGGGGSSSNGGASYEDHDDHNDDHDDDHDDGDHEEHDD